MRDIDGKSILSGEKPLGEARGELLPFSAEIPVAPGTYIVRLAVMDSSGRVGSVDYRVDARPVELGELTASRPLLIRLPADLTGSLASRSASCGRTTDLRCRWISRARAL